MKIKRTFLLLILTGFSYLLNAQDSGSDARVTNIPDDEPPTAPSNLTAGTVTQTTIAVSWTASTDNVGVAGYNVYVNGTLNQTVSGLSANITGLTASTNYSIYVTAYDYKDNESPASNTIQVSTSAAADTQAPTAPTNLAAGTITQTSIAISWTASTDNVGVQDYQVLVNGTVRSTVTNTSTTLTGLTASTAYTIRVRARDAANNVSANSNQISVTTLSAADTQAPTAPTGLAAGTVTTTSVAISWNASTDNVGVAGYRVYVGGNLNSTVAASSTSTTITGLTQSETYNIFVRAYDAAGNQSTNSNQIQVVTETAADTQAPTVPTNLASGTVTQNSIVLSWTASNDNVGVTGYDLSVNGTVQTVTTTTHTLINLPAASTFTIRVRARDAAGNVSAYTSAINVTTPDTEAPSTPTGLTTESVAPTQIIVKWNASIDNVGVEEYVVYLDGVQYQVVSLAQCQITGLTPNTSYTINVRARDASDNESGLSSDLLVTTPLTVDNEPPTAPSNLTQGSVTPYSVYLTWDGSNDNVGVVGYQIQISEANGNNPRYLVTTDTEFTVTQLTPNTEYKITVVALDAAGNESSGSNQITFTTTEQIISAIKKGDIREDIKVYQLASGQLNIEMPSETISDVRVRIYNLSGQRFMDSMVRMNGSVNQLNGVNLAKGIYVIRISENKNEFVKKFLIQ